MWWWRRVAVGVGVGLRCASTSSTAATAEAGTVGQQLRQRHAKLLDAWQAQQSSASLAELDITDAKLAQFAVAARSEHGSSVSRKWFEKQLRPFINKLLALASKPTYAAIPARAHQYPQLHAALTDIEQSVGSSASAAAGGGVVVEKESEAPKQQQKQKQQRSRAKVVAGEVDGNAASKPWESEESKGKSTGKKRSPRAAVTKANDRPIKGPLLRGPIKADPGLSDLAYVTSPSGLGMAGPRLLFYPSGVFCRGHRSMNKCNACDLQTVCGHDAIPLRPRNPPDPGQGQPDAVAPSPHRLRAKQEVCGCVTETARARGRVVVAMVGSEAKTGAARDV